MLQFLGLVAKRAGQGKGWQMWWRGWAGPNQGKDNKGGGAGAKGGGDKGGGGGGGGDGVDGLSAEVRETDREMTSGWAAARQCDAISVMDLALSCSLTTTG